MTHETNPKEALVFPEGFPPILQHYFSIGMRLAFWPPIEDWRGPRDNGWQEHLYTPQDYQPGYRVGLITGVEISPGKYFHDVDVDWAPGQAIAARLLPQTDFVYGRASKRVSHAGYTLPEAVPLRRFEDLDKTCLIEARGSTGNGSLGHQSMCPPSVWVEKGNFSNTELLTFLKTPFPIPQHLESAKLYLERTTYSAIGMLFARRFGVNGFGHEMRLMWAGYLLRLGIPVPDLILMGEGISELTNNQEVSDVRRVVESTSARLADPKQKIKGGPALAQALGSEGTAVLARISEWLGRDADFVRSAEGKIIPDHQANIKFAVEHLGKELAYDEFSDKLLLDGRAMEDQQVNELWLRIDEELKFRPTFIFFEKVIRRVAWNNAFHPVKDYLKSLTWDKVPRLDTWLRDSAGAEDSKYLRVVSSIPLIAAVRRIYHPGSKYDEMLVLESSQGLNKSSAIRALCPNPSWFSDDLPLNLKSQQMIEATLGKWILEAADLAGKRKTEIEQLKAMMSRQVDGPARLAYARLPVERARHFILVGTTNSKAYMTDPTGARRFWPVEIKKFDVAWVLVNRDQLWAEACVREANGESIRMPEELWGTAAEHQEARREIDPWEVVIRDHLETAPISTDRRRRVQTGHLWDALSIEVARRDRIGALRISDIMQRLKYERTRVRDGDSVGVGYISDPIPETESEGAPEPVATVREIPF